jgi:hypothetical protein
MNNENGNRKRSTKGKVAIQKVQMGWSRGKKRKEKGKSYRGNCELERSVKKREKKKDAWKEKSINMQ